MPKHRNLDEEGSPKLESNQQHCNNADDPHGCSCPTGCVFGDPVDISEPEDAVKIICSNADCPMSPWIHRACLDGWENQLLSLLRSSSRTRTWSERQRVNALWTKRGYDVTFKACACVCGHGYAKKDPDYTPPLTDGEQQPFGGVANGAAKAARNRHRRQRAVAAAANTQPVVKQQLTTHKSNGRQSPPMGRMRSRTLSLGSAAGLTDQRLRSMGLLHNTTDASGRSSFDEEPQTRMHSNSIGYWPLSAQQRRSHRRSTGEDTTGGYFDDDQVKSTGSIFKRRASLSVLLQQLPPWKRNGFYVRLEDDCPQGSDDTRIFLLTQLGRAGRRHLACVLCAAAVDIYDRYPLVDGCFFLSPIDHRNRSVRVRHEGRDANLHALCIQCLSSERADRVACRRCGSYGWLDISVGRHAVIGGLYLYDLLSTAACCAPQCAKCTRTVPLPAEASGRASFFSTFSEMAVCPSCGAKDYHYIRRLDSLHLLPASPPPAPPLPPSAAATVDAASTQQSLDNYTAYLLQQQNNNAKETAVGVWSSADLANSVGYGLLEAIELDEAESSPTGTTAATQAFKEINPASLVLA